MSHSRRLTDRPKLKDESEAQATVLQFPGRRADDHQVGERTDETSSPDLKVSERSEDFSVTASIRATQPSTSDRVLGSKRRVKVRVRSIFSMAAVFSVPLLSLYLSQAVQMKDADRGSRSLASVGPLSFERDELFEAKIAMNFGQARRDVAGVQLGRAPNAEEKLRYHDLQGEYRVLLKQNKLALIESNAASQRLISIRDGEKFLLRQLALLPHGVERIVAIEKSDSPSGTRETFALMSGDRSVGEVTMELDPQRKLRSVIVTE